MLRDSEILQSSGYLVEAKLKFVKWSIDRKVDAMEYVPTSLRGTVKPRIILRTLSLHLLMPPPSNLIFQMAAPATSPAAISLLPLKKHINLP